ncbi:MAG: hypothetical protein ACLR23_17075 [Clostridia bacterium]
MAYIIEGMRKALTGEINFDEYSCLRNRSRRILIWICLPRTAFWNTVTAQSSLLRLQKSKTNPERFEVSTITEYLKKSATRSLLSKPGAS